MINYEFREGVLLLSLGHYCPYVNFVTDPVQGYPNNNAVTCKSVCKTVFRVIHCVKQTSMCSYQKLLATPLS